MNNHFAHGFPEGGALTPNSIAAKFNAEPGRDSFNLLGALLVPLVLSIGGLLIFSLLKTLGISPALPTLIPILGACYFVYLLFLSPLSQGKLSLLMLWIMITLLLLWLPVSSLMTFGAHTLLLTLIRALLLRRSLPMVGIELAVGACALIGALWCLLSTGSLGLSI